MRKRLHNCTLPPRKFTRPQASSGSGTHACPAIGCRHRVWPQKLFCPAHLAFISPEDVAALHAARKASTQTYWKNGKEISDHSAKLHYQRLHSAIVCRVSDAEWQQKTEVQA